MRNGLTETAHEDATVQIAVTKNGQYGDKELWQRQKLRYSARLFSWILSMELAGVCICDGWKKWLAVEENQMMEQYIVMRCGPVMQENT